MPPEPSKGANCEWCGRSYVAGAGDPYFDPQPTPCCSWECRDARSRYFDGLHDESLVEDPDSRAVVERIAAHPEDVPGVVLAWTLPSFWSASQFARQLSRRFARDALVSADGADWKVSIWHADRETQDRRLYIDERDATAKARGQELKLIVDKILMEIEGVVAGYGITSESLETLRWLSAGIPIHEDRFEELACFVQGMESRVFGSSTWSPDPWRAKESDVWP